MRRNKTAFEQLKTRWINKHLEIQKEIFKSHKESFEWFIHNSKQFTIGSLAGIFLLTSPIVNNIPASYSSDSTINQMIDKKAFLIFDLKSILPVEVRQLSDTEENQVGKILTRNFGIPVSAQILGKRLNTSYGFIGQEQHLARFPGDNMFIHFETETNSTKYFQYGMAPGLGAWRYFANSKQEMTQKDIDREKYYIAVQTFLAPGFDKDPKGFVDFFKYRKMLVVNPQNGKAIVAVIGDAGPSPWTGKQLGGSPEVMNYLERHDGSQKGSVLYYFIDDPNDTIPLGPINAL